MTALWAKYAGPEGRVLGVDTFGESAPGAALYKHFHLTTEAVEKVVGELLEQ